MSGGGYSLLESALAESRSRTSWNSWLEQAERPASDHEEARIIRAANMATLIVNTDQFLLDEQVRVLPQGSYYNNTNARNEADMDLRVQLKEVKLDFENGVDPDAAFAQKGYIPLARPLEHTGQQVRHHLEAALIKKFGPWNVDTSGNKAIKVKGLDGSRADCDLVPAFRFHNIFRSNGQLFNVEGVAIFGDDGSWTHNFPQQHHDNGIAKRARTSHRFKKNVRMLKRLNYELEAVSDISNRLPSFLVECLVYCVEDEHFLIEEDDRWLRLIRLLYRLEVLLESESWTENATEISGLKYLFWSNQSWTAFQAKQFVRAALDRLEA